MRLKARLAFMGINLEFNLEDIEEIIPSNDLLYARGIPYKLSTVRSVDAEKMCEILDKIVEKASNKGTTPDHLRACKLLFSIGRMALDIVTDYRE